MLCSSSSSSFSSDDGSESNSDRSSGILGDSEASFVFRAACNSEEPLRQTWLLKQSGNSSSKGALPAK